MGIEINTAPKVALRKPEVLKRVGFSNTHLYRLVQNGQFPKPYKLSERVSVWSESEVNAWLQSKFQPFHVGGATC